MRLKPNWEVQYLGGPFDGRTEVHASSHAVPRIAVLAMTGPPCWDEPSVGPKLSSVAVYELAPDSTTYRHVASLPAADSVAGRQTGFLSTRQADH